MCGLLSPSTSISSILWLTPFEATSKITGFFGWKLLGLTGFGVNVSIPSGQIVGGVGVVVVVVVVVGVVVVGDVVGVVIQSIPVQGVVDSVGNVYGVDVYVVVVAVVV